MLQILLLLCPVITPNTLSFRPGTQQRLRAIGRITDNTSNTDSDKREYKLSLTILLPLFSPFPIFWCLVTQIFVLSTHKLPQTLDYIKLCYLFIVQLRL